MAFDSTSHMCGKEPDVAGQDCGAAVCGASRDLSDIDMAKLVVAALRGLAHGNNRYVHAAWASASVAEVSVEDLNPDEYEDGVCGGQGNAFKVSLVDTPSLDQSLAQWSVVLHRLRDGEHQDTFCVRCRKAAAQVFSEHGLGPRQLVSEVGDWWIESFEGVRCGPWTAETDFWAMGQLLAQVHKSVPTMWFDKYRAEIIAKWPLMSKVAAGSHAWVCIPWVLWGLDCFSHSLTELESEIEAHSGDAEDISFIRAIKAFDEDPEFFAEWADMGAFTPQHPFAKRLVTIHGDFHPGNVLVKGNQSATNFPSEANSHLCIDFEQTCVSNAIYDLAFAVNSEIPAFVDNEPGKQEAMARVFLAAYLDGMGQAHTSDAELNMLVTDCMLGGFVLKEVGLLHWDCFMRASRQDEFVARDDPRRYLRQCKAWAAGVREGGPAMCAQVADGHGPMWEGKVWPCRRVEESDEASNDES